MWVVLRCLCLLALLLLGCDAVESGGELASASKSCDPQDESASAEDGIDNRSCATDYEFVARLEGVCHKSPYLVKEDFPVTLPLSKFDVAIKNKKIIDEPTSFFALILPNEIYYTRTLIASLPHHYTVRYPCSDFATRSEVCKLMDAAVAKELPEIRKVFYQTFDDHCKGFGMTRATIAKFNNRGKPGRDCTHRPLPTPGGKPIDSTLN